MKRWLLLAVVCLGVLLFGVACGPDKAENAAKIDWLNEVVEVKPTLQDGRQVTCLIYGGYQKGGLSCDWAGAR
jgi:hypothetical protein